MTDIQMLEIVREIINGNLGGARELCEKYCTEIYCLQVGKIILEDFEEYEKKILNLSKEEIFNKAFEINAMMEITNFFQDTDCLTDEQYKILLKADEIKGSLIEKLYGFFLSVNDSSVNNYEDISQWIGWFCDKEKERMKNDKN